MRIKRNQRGFTLLELMTTLALLSIFAVMMLSMTMSLTQSADFQSSRMIANDEARVAMMILRKDLRHAVADTIAWGDLPSTQLTFQRPVDTDANGHPLDLSGLVELGPAVTIMRDTNDINEDGRTDTQLVAVSGNDVRVLANNLMPDEDADGDGLLGADEDRNNNNQLDRGILFNRVGQTIFISIQTEHRESGNAHVAHASVQQSVNPRN